MTIRELAELVNGTVDGDSSMVITGVAALRDASEGDISFLSNPRYAPQVAGSKAAAVLVHNDWTGEHTGTLVHVESPDKAFAQIVPLFAPKPVVHKPGIHPTAVVGEDVELGDGVHIGAYAVIGDRCKIGAGCVIEAHVVIGEDCVLDTGCHLYPMVSLRERIKLGKRVAIHNGSVIGSDGYGYSVSVGPDGKPVVEKIPQLGTVELDDDVEIGANVTIDRARFGVTRLGRSVKVDNLVQIAHNVQVGECSGIVAHVGISGSTHIGSGVMLWGQVGVAGHLDIGDGATVLAQSGVSKNVPAGATVFGAPAVDRREAVKTMMLPRTVETLKNRIAELEKNIAELKKAAETAI